MPTEQEESEEPFLQEVDVLGDEGGGELVNEFGSPGSTAGNIEINKMYSATDNDMAWCEEDERVYAQGEDKVSTADVIKQLQKLPLFEDKEHVQSSEASGETKPPQELEHEQGQKVAVGKKEHSDSDPDLDRGRVTDPDKKLHATLERRHTEVFGEVTDTDSLLHTYSATSLANEWSTLAWKTYDSEITYTVKYIPSTPEDSVAYMNRFNEGAYEEACGKEFTLMMFPPDNSVLQYFPHLIATHEVLGYSVTPNTDVAFRMEFLFMNHLIKAIRLQKILLLQEYQSLKEKIIIFKEFLVLCNKKMDAQKHRLGILENELVLLEPYSGFNPSSLMGSFLSSAVGWVAFQTFFDKELKYLQNLVKERVKAQEKERSEAAKAAKKEALRLKKEASRKKLAESAEQDTAGLGGVLDLNTDGGGQDNGSGSDVSSLATGSNLMGAEDKNSPAKSATGSAAGGDSVVTETESMIIERILNRQGLGLTREEMGHIWCLVRYWQVVNSVAVRAHLGSDAAYRTYSSGGGGVGRAGKGEGGSKKSKSAVEQQLELECPDLPALLPGGGAGVAGWAGVCSVLGLQVPTSYRAQSAGEGRAPATNQSKEEEFENLMQASAVLLELITTQPSESTEDHPHHAFVTTVTPCISRVAASNLSYTVQERDVFASPGSEEGGEYEGAEDDFNRTIDTVKLGKCLLAVADDIGDAIQDLVIEKFRRLKVWSDVLDNMRKERVKKEGGQIMLRDNQEVEIDEQGAIRVIPNADDIVDTDVLHKSKQRVRVQIAIPQATRELKMMKARKYDVQGEVAAVTQLGFTTVAAYVQRAIRGSLVRKKVHRYHRANIVLFAMHAAATTVQARQRQIMAKRRYKERVLQRRIDAARKIQSRLRGFHCRKLIALLQQEREKRQRHDGAVAMQKIIRGFLGRCVVKSMLNNAFDEKQKANYAWASLTIQKYVRRYIAQHSIVRSRHIRNNLSPQVLVLAERYMTKTNGDLWGFLKEVDETMKRLSGTIEQNQEREETWADTFTKSVLEKRQTEFDSSWSTFADQQQRIKKPTLGPDIKTQAMSAAGGTGTASRGSKSRRGAGKGGTRSVSMLDTFDASSNLSILNTANMEGVAGGNGLAVSNPPPGAFMRRVISSTMVQGSRVQAAALKASTAQADANRARVQTIKDAYAPIPKHKQRGGGTRGLVPKAGQIQKKERQSVFAATNKFKVVEKKKAGLSEAFLRDDWVFSKGGKGDQSATRGSSSDSNLFQTQGADTRSSLVSPGKGTRTGALSPLKGGRRGGGKAYAGVMESAEELHHQKRQHDPGVSLLVDVPKGMGDKMERLLQAAAMRCYVPDLFWRGEDGEPSVTHAEAYRMYLDLPDDSLAKLRYEQKVHMWCAGPANRLRLKGFNFISETLPISKMGMFLKSVECPRVLIDKTLEIAHELQAMATMPDGLLHKGFKEDLELLQSGKGTRQTAIRAGVEEHRLERQESWEEEQSRLQEEERVKQEEARALEATNELKARSQALLEDMFTKGKWTDPNSPMDGMLQHAAFLICPHKDNDKLLAEGVVKGRMEGLFDSPGEEETEDEKRMGHMAFMSFAQEMMSASTEQEAKICIRDRYRAAVILSTPFELKLQDLKVFSVRDLATLTSDGVKGSSAVAACLQSMPKPYRMQLEALLSMVVSIEENSSVYPGAGESKCGTVIRTTSITKDPNQPPPQMVGPLIDNPRLIQAPLVFDKKFQRGPFDPYGRPARLPGQLPSLVQHSAATRKFRLYGNSGSVMNEIGADNAIAISVAESVRRQQEVKDQLAASGVYIHADVEEMFTSLPSGLFEMSKQSQKKVQSVLEEEEDQARDLLKDDTFQSMKRDDDITTKMWTFEPDKSMLKKKKTSSEQPLSRAHTPHNSHSRGNSRGNTPLSDHTHKHISFADTTTPLAPAADVNISTETTTPLPGGEEAAGGGQKEEEEVSQDQTGPQQGRREAAMREAARAQREKSSATHASSSSRRAAKLARAKKSGVRLTSLGETFDTEHAFDRPHTCKFEGCGQAFSRLYTLKLHEKSHLMFPDYYKYKRDPMLGYDLDRQQMEAETRARLLSLENLPLLREQELEHSTLFNPSSSSLLDTSDNKTKSREAEDNTDAEKVEVLQRQARRKQVQAKIRQEKEQRKLSLNHYR